MLSSEDKDTFLTRFADLVQTGLQDCSVQRADGQENLGLVFRSEKDSRAVHFNVSRLFDFMDFGSEPYFELTDIPFDEELAVSGVRALLCGSLLVTQTSAFGLKLGHSSRLKLDDGSHLCCRGIGLLELLIPFKNRMTFELPGICELGSVSNS